MESRGKEARKQVKKGQRDCEGEINFIAIFGTIGLLAYLTGVIQGYLRGFLGEHRTVRRVCRILVCTSAAFAVVVFTVSMVFPIMPQLQQKTEIDAVIAQAAEEMPVLESDEDKSADVTMTLVEKLSEVLPEISGYGNTLDDQVPLDDSVMEPSDIYAEKGSTAVFKAYHPSAQEYQWEIYDLESKSWELSSQESVSEREDELHRKISFLELSADQERKVRCQIRIGGGISISYEADLHILSGQISSISVDEFRADAGAYASAQDIPVQVTYQDGNQESIVGLNGLYFLEQSESSENSTTGTGVIQETITTVRTAREYDYIDQGSKEGVLLYQKNNGDSVSIPVNITGVDLTAPKITEYRISDFEVSNVDKGIPVTVTIRAEDNLSRHLTYAFLPEGEEPKEEDWMEESVFQAEITQNGIWRAYCRDEAGNIGTKEQEIIAVDTKAPAIRLTLEQEGWCQENKILVTAEDSLVVEYRYLCEESGTDSGWTVESSICVSENGNWKVQVRDAAGNMAEKEITVDNIDTRAPVIRSITEKTEGETISNEE